MVVNRDDQFELNTLKISADTKRSVRKPYVWEKPNPRLYDYHYEIGGLYYQPMIKYITSRKGGERQTVEIPDRILSNFDRRAYDLKTGNLELEEFLTDSYKRRMRDINTKFVRVENEKIRKSKRTSELNMIRGAATTRDKYLCKLQLYYTGHAAHRDEEEVLGNLGKDEDAVYSPGYERTVIKRKSKADQNQEKRISELFEEKYYHEDRETVSNKFKKHLGHLNTSTGQFMKRYKEIKDMTGEQTEDDLLPPSTFMIALSDVKKKIEEKRKEIENVKCHPSELKIAFKGTQIDEVGLNERCFLKSEQFKPRSLPDFDLGYDTVDRL